MKLSLTVILVSTAIISQSASPQQSSLNIRSVDFANFTYPWTSDLGDARKSFTLRKGERPPTRNKHGFIEEMGVFFQSAAAIEQSLAADGAIACFSSNLIPSA